MKRRAWLAIGCCTIVLLSRATAMASDRLAIVSFNGTGGRSMGNAYFGFALTPPIDLTGKSHEISITTTRAWGAVKEHYTLVLPKD